MFRHPRCVFIKYNWINQLSNTTIWWLDICHLLHRHQLHVSAFMAIFRLIDWQQTCKQLYFGIHFVYGGGVLGLDGGTRSCVCWVGRVMWVHGYYCTGLGRHNSTISFLATRTVRRQNMHVILLTQCINVWKELSPTGNFFLGIHKNFAVSSLVASLRTIPCNT